MKDIDIAAFSLISSNDVRSFLGGNIGGAVNWFVERFIFQDTISRRVCTIGINQMNHLTEMKVLTTKLICIIFNCFRQLFLNVCRSYIKICSDVTVHDFDNHCAAVEDFRKYIADLINIKQYAIIISVYVKTQKWFQPFTAIKIFFERIFLCSINTGSVIG